MAIPTTDIAKNTQIIASIKQIVWIELQVTMLYNKDVTKVEIYVSNPVSIPAVNEIVESLIMDMSSTGCTYHTRRLITQFSVLEVPHSKCR